MNLIIIITIIIFIPKLTNIIYTIIKGKKGKNIKTKVSQLYAKKKGLLNINKS
jgi:hypothetical protein